MKQRKFNVRKYLLLTLSVLTLGLVGCTDIDDDQLQGDVQEEVVIQDAPIVKDQVVDLEGNDDVNISSTPIYKVIETDEVTIINNNIPFFDNDDLTHLEAYHKSGRFDELGRTTAANAVVGTELMPASGSRESISHVYPTGWKQAKYANIGSGGWLYNRSHLIGHQMTGNNDAENLMTGTRWFNVAMIEYENYIAHHVEETDELVRYRVTPVYKGDNLVASGIYMEAYSLEDSGEGVMFNIYVPNVQPDVTIDYLDGTSVGPEGPLEYKDSEEILPHQSQQQQNNNDVEKGDLKSVDTDGNGRVTIKEAKEAGFKMPIKKGHWLYEYMHDADGDGQVGE